MALNNTFIDPNTIPSSYVPSYYGGKVGNKGGKPKDKGKGALGGFGGAAIDSLIPGAGGIINYATGSGNIYDLIDPSGVLSLFGLGDKGAGSFKPYLNEAGNLVWNNPNSANPIPVSNVPGSRLKPSKTYQKMANNAQAIQDLLPYLNNATLQTIMPSALANLDAAKVTSPAYAELMTQLYNQYGPALNDIGNTILNTNAKAAAKTDLDVLSGTGQDLVRKAYETSQVFDKPYYDQRSKTMDAINNLIGSIDLNGNLSNTELDAIQKGNALEGARNGTANAPSNLQAITNATKYGAAGNARKVQQQNLLSDAISKSTAFLPTAKSGVDVFQVATGKSSMPNPGNSQFTGIKSSDSSNQYGLAGQMFQGGTGLQTTQMGIDANKKDWLDKFNQIASGIGSITGSLGSVAGIACWVAREVYGSYNPKWMQFRNWLFSTNSPMWFFKLYIKHGQQIAQFIKDKPVIKYLIRKWMDTKIYSN